LSRRLASTQPLRCGSVRVKAGVVHTQGATAINQARAFTGEDDMEGALWQVIEDRGGHQSGSATAAYWIAPPPTWWLKALADRWLSVILLILVYCARGKSERVYRQVVTKAATGGDWKAAEFMLTHSPPTGGRRWTGWRLLGQREALYMCRGMRGRRWVFWRCWLSVGRRMTRPLNDPPGGALKQLNPPR